MSNHPSPTQELQALAVTALLGSDRAARAGETPAALLARAAIAGMRARAGCRRRAAAISVETCPMETCAIATASQTAILERLLASPETALIHEWCTLARARDLGKSLCHSAFAVVFGG